MKKEKARKSTMKLKNINQMKQGKEYFIALAKSGWWRIRKYEKALEIVEKDFNKYDVYEIKESEK